MNSPPISRRLSNRLAARAALISSSSVAPVGAIGFEQYLGEQLAAGTVFYYPEAKLGTTGGISSSLVTRMPHHLGMEMMLLGLVAYRVGKKLHYDGVAGRVSDCSEANELLARKYRSGWTLNG